MYIGLRLNAMLRQRWLALICITLSALCFWCCTPSDERANSRKSPSRRHESVSFVKELPRLLLINSYDYGYPWTRGITRAAAALLQVQLDEQGYAKAQSTGAVLLKIEYMDTKRNVEPDFIASAVRRMEGVIEQFQPDLLLVSDDNAVKYLVVPNCRKWKFPVIFCGVNGSADEYDLPPEKVVGMVEVQLVDQIVDHLQKYAKGPRIGFLKGNDYSARKEAQFYAERLNLPLDIRLVATFDQWKEQYLRLQSEVDMLLIGNSSRVMGWDAQQAKVFIDRATRIPTGNWDSWMAPFALITLATQPEEQGRWIANQALKILDGVPVSQLENSQNRQAAISLNMTLAKKLGITFPANFLLQARLAH
ncbi:ABC transporter substrate-binding protein [Desulfogranum japonicum]|uniref:ABC transporter substrate-binding protein n=1 Tax=Desulfogranum japonicum TaxID=231447 RepID=UPI0004145869|nr:hypothetical protein [Desulfogranum japonicum]